MKAIPWRGKSQGQRSLVGYSPRGGKETHTAEHTHTCTQWKLRSCKALYTSVHNSFATAWNLKKTLKYPSTDGWITIYSTHNATILSNKKESAIDAGNGQLYISQSKYAECKKPDRKSAYFMTPFIWNSRKCTFISSDRKQINACLDGSRGQGRIEMSGWQESDRKLRADG